MRGHIKQRSKSINSWTVVIELGKAENKRKQKWYTIHGSKKDAEKFLTEKLRELDTGTYVDCKNMNVHQYLEYWYEQCCLSKLSPTTYESYRRNLDKYLIKELGHIKLEELQPLHLQTFYNKCSKNGLSKTTTLYLHRILHSALNQAMKWQLVTRNVLDCVDVPKPKRYEAKVLDSKELLCLIRAIADTEIYIPIMIAIATGMRRGEVLGLTWNNVDLENKNIKVVQALYPTEKGLVILEPKTQKSVRNISIPITLVEILKKHKVKQDLIKLETGFNYNNQSFVCCSSSGKIISPSSLNHKFRDILVNNELTLIRFHDLRHSHASLLLSQGIQPKVISERLRHSNINITMDLYSHVYDATNREVADNFDKFLKVI